MNGFFILVGASVAGIAAVFWLLKNDDRPSGVLSRGLGAPAAQPAAKPSLLAGLFARLMAGKKHSRDDAAEEIPIPSVTDVAGNVLPVGGNPGSAPAARGGALSADEEKKIEQEIDLAARLEEWEEKYERLDKLFNEKSAALAKSEESLRNELNNRKEFNKVKDILEKELKDHKDKARNIQVELTAAMAESEGYKKRITQMEEKVAKLEKTVMGKEHEAAELSKRLQQSAAGAPGVTAAPPESKILLSSQQPASNQSEEPVGPEEKPQGSQDKPGSEGQTNENDQKE